MAFQHSSLICCIPLAKDHSLVKDHSKIRSLAICINIKASNQVNRKQLNFLKTILEYLELYIVAYWKWFSLKSYLTNHVPRAGCFFTPLVYKNIGVCWNVRRMFDFVIKVLCFLLKLTQFNILSFKWFDWSMNADEKLFDEKMLDLKCIEKILLGFDLQNITRNQH